MPSRTSEPWPGDGFNLENARLELAQLVDYAWNSAAGPASPQQPHQLQFVAYDLAARIFVSGKIAGRPSMEALEQVIAEASERVRGFPNESRGIAEAVMALLEDPKQERRALLPISPRQAEARYQYSRQREQGDSGETLPYGNTSFSPLDNLGRVRCFKFGPHAVASRP